MKVIIPIEITDANMDSSIPYPDVASGEALWQDPATSLESDYIYPFNTTAGGIRYTVFVASANGLLYTLIENDNEVIERNSDMTATGNTWPVPSNSNGITFDGSDFWISYGYDIVQYSSSFVATGFSFTAPVESGSSGAFASYVAGFIAVIYYGRGFASYSKIKLYNDSGTLQEEIQLTTDGLTGLCWDGVNIFALSETKKIHVLNSDYSDTGFSYDTIAGSNDSDMEYHDGKILVSCRYLDDGQIVTYSGTNGLISVFTDVGVQVAHDNLIYQSVVQNIDNPSAGSLLAVPSWVKVSAANKYRAFDYEINSKSIVTNVVNTYIFTPGVPITEISLFGLAGCVGVGVMMRENSSAGAVLISTSAGLGLVEPVGDLIANDELYRDKYLFDDLPVHDNPWISIRFTLAAGFTEMEVGAIVLGSKRNIGQTQYQSSTGMISYNTVDTDNFGNQVVTRRPSAEYTTFEVTVEPVFSQYVERILKDTNGVPCVWVGDTVQEINREMFTLGYHERTPIVRSSPSRYKTTIKVRGLV